MALITISDFRFQENFKKVPPEDAKLKELIKYWQSWIEQVTGNYFEKKSISFYMDGNDSEMLHLAIPIITITHLRINDSTTDLPTDEYVVYSGRTPPNDDRQNPKIVLKQNYRRNIFTDTPIVPTLGQVSKRRFLRGERNQYIEGEFGYLEADDSVPQPIIRALKRLVLKDANAIAGGNTVLDTVDKSRLISQTTDKHSYKLSASSGSGVSLTGDQEVDKILSAYRAPAAMAVPRDW